jgi:hypothetical protein
MNLRPNQWERLQELEDKGNDCSADENDELQELLDILYDQKDYSHEL